MLQELQGSFEIVAFYVQTVFNSKPWLLQQMKSRVARKQVIVSNCSIIAFFIQSGNLQLGASF